MCWIKECLSKDEADEIKSRGSRKTYNAECLKVSVEPDPEWDGHGENYCYHDISSNELALQVANVGFWMTVEWGVTAGATVFGSPAAGVAAKPVMGFISGAGCEYTSQYITKEKEQVWPGHPV